MSTSCAALLRLRLRAVDPILGGTHEHMAALVSIGLGRSDEVWKSHGLEPRMPGTLHGLPLSVRAEQGAQGGGPHRGTSRTRKPRRMGVKKSAIRHVGHAQGATPVGCGIGRPVVPNLSLVNVRISWLHGWKGLYRRSMPSGSCRRASGWGMSLCSGGSCAVPSAYTNVQCASRPWWRNQPLPRGP